MDRQRKPPATGIRIGAAALGGLCLLALSGCASLSAERNFVGRPIAMAVDRLGPPHSVIDEYEQGRYFTWWPGSSVVFDRNARNPSNWLEAETRTDPWPARLDESGYANLPPLRFHPPFEPPQCGLTLLATWDEARRSWIAKREFRPGAKGVGGCGPNVVRQ